MPRAVRPSSPADDLAARHSWRGDDGALAPDIAAFCQRGLSICLASSDRRGEPIAGLGLACRQDGPRLRILLVRRGHERLLRAVAEGAPVAATFSQPETHRSIQLKSASASLAPFLPADEPELLRQSAAMRDELVSVGYSAAFATIYSGLDRQEMAAVVLVPEQAFVQTPGPTARSALP
jgi:hypothetical protein